MDVIWTHTNPLYIIQTFVDKKDWDLPPLFSSPITDLMEDTIITIDNLINNARTYDPFKNDPIYHELQREVGMGTGLPYAGLKLAQLLMK